jgi:hypothetical protein
MPKFCGEPALDEMLSDPIIRALMKADGTDVSQTCDILLRARRATTTASGETGDRNHGAGFGSRS